jgi:hypothetical protein
MLTGKSVWARADNDVFAGGSDYIGVSQQPVVDHFDGVSWQQMVLPSVSASYEQVQQVIGSPSGEVYARSFEAFYELVGTTWMRRFTTLSPTSTAAWAVAADDVWLARNATRDVVRWNGTTQTPVVGIPTVATGYVRALWGTDAAHMFLGFINGVAILTGSTWSFVPTSFPVQAIHGSSATNVSVVLSNGSVLHYDGARFTDVAPSGSQFTAVWNTGAEVFATTFAGVQRWSGSSWLRTTGEFDGYDPAGVWVADTAVFEAVESGVYTLDSQNAWVLTSGAAQFVSYIWGFSATDVWGLDGSTGTVVHFDGSSWQTTASVANPRAIWGPAAGDLWVVTYSGGTYTVLRGDGTTFTPVHTGTAPATGYLIHMHGTSANDVWLTLGDAQIVHWDGASWTTTTIPNTPLIKSVFALTSTDAVAVGDDGLVLRWNGSTWTPQLSGTPQDLTTVWGRAGNDVFAAGRFGTIVHYDGATWTPVRDPRGGASDIYSVAGSEHLVVFTRTDTAGGDVLYRVRPW